MSEPTQPHSAFDIPGYAAFLDALKQRMEPEPEAPVGPSPTPEENV